MASPEHLPGIRSAPTGTPTSPTNPRHVRRSPPRPRRLGTITGFNEPTGMASPQRPRVWAAPATTRSGRPRRRRDHRSIVGFPATVGITDYTELLRLHRLRGPGYPEPSQQPTPVRPSRSIQPNGDKARTSSTRATRRSSRSAPPRDPETAPPSPTPTHGNSGSSTRVHRDLHLRLETTGLRHLPAFILVLPDAAPHTGTFQFRNPGRAGPPAAG